MNLFRILICFFVLQTTVFAQSSSDKISISSGTVGISAISLHTLVAKTYGLNMSFYNYESDSLSNLFLFSLRQQSEDGKNFLNKAFIGALDASKDTMNWFSESNTYDLEIAGNSLFYSSAAKTMRVNKVQGFEENKYPSRLLYSFVKKNKGFMYLPTGSEVLSCVNLSDGAVNWTAGISGKENWLDTKTIKDSVLVIAAAGLSAVDLQRGLLWTYPLVTATKVNKALTYSLANDNQALEKISRVVKTSNEENDVTELSSNILTDENGTVYFASKEKMIAVDTEGKLLWELDLRAYPVSKMYLSRQGSSITLINFGLAKYADNYVVYGKPFVLTINPSNGTINNTAELKEIDNLVDFKETKTSFLFAGKTAILELKKTNGQPELLLDLNIAKYGNFFEFIDGDAFRVEKEGFYVTLNFINDNLIYFRADNNKIYGVGKEAIDYEYHFNEIYQLEEVFDNKILLRGEDKSLIISKNMELLATLAQPFKGKALGDKLILLTERRMHVLHVKDIR
jgi:hypothetical protein